MPNTDSAALIASLRERVRILVAEQAEALEDAVYIPMSDEQMTSYNERGERLNELRHELMSLLSDTPIFHIPVDK